jgi:septal ring factor EnvC (AmiA/AmiB activator)
MSEYDCKDCNPVVNFKVLKTMVKSLEKQLASEKSRNDEQHHQILTQAGRFKQLQSRNDELEAKLKALEHIGSEDDSLVNRLLGVYETNGIKRDFTKDGHFIPAIHKEAAHRIKELEARVNEADFMESKLKELGYCKHGAWVTGYCQPCGRINSN